MRMAAQGDTSNIEKRQRPLIPVVDEYARAARQNRGRLDAR